MAISRDQNVYPMVAPGAALDDVMGAIDVAVGAVRTDMPSGAQNPPSVSPCAQLDAQFGGRWELNPQDVGQRMERSAAEAAGLAQSTAPGEPKEEGEA